MNLEYKGGLQQERTLSYAAPMSEAAAHLTGPNGRLAYRRLAGAGPTLVWLGGFRSDMLGTKAQALADWAASQGRALLRFDYSGHGESDGRFEDGTIGAWKADALAAIDQLTEGPLVLVGSSMGGWLASLVALERPERVAGMVLLAPAADFTEALMRGQLPADALASIERTGSWTQPCDYGGDAYTLTRQLLDEGGNHLILNRGPVALRCPVRILQGAEDPDVPWRHALALAEALESRDVVFTLIKDGDHRLSRPQDLERLQATLQELLTAIGSAGSS